MDNMYVKVEALIFIIWDFAVIFLKFFYLKLHIYWKWKLYIFIYI